jgi:hypothetical protein
MNSSKEEKNRLKKIVELLKALKGKKPDRENLDFSSWNQSEEEYQKEQAKWAEEVKKRKRGRSKYMI